MNAAMMRAAFDNGEAATRCGTRRGFRTHSSSVCRAGGMTESGSHPSSWSYSLSRTHYQGYALAWSRTAKRQCSLSRSNTFRFPALNKYARGM